jgi:hypothetical protein
MTNDSINLADFERPMTKEEQESADEYGRLSEQWCREGMAECGAKWKAEGKIFAWCKDEPEWAPHCQVFVGKFWEDEREPFPTMPCQITTWFSLIGGGRIGVVQRWQWFRATHTTRTKELARSYPLYKIWQDERTLLVEVSVVDHRLIVQAHTSDGLYRCTGNLHTHQCDIFAYAAVFNGGVPQEIADRVAKTLGAVDWKDSYYALLDSSEGCTFCGRPLRDEVSQLVGVGPDCARKHGIPHSMAAANKRLEIRRKILGEAEQLKH